MNLFSWPQISTCSFIDRIVLDNLQKQSQYFWAENFPILFFFWFLFGFDPNTFYHHYLFFSPIIIRKMSMMDLHENTGPKFVGIKFCQECNNMLYPKEDKDNRILLYACRNCDFKQMAENSCVYVNRIMHEIE